MSLGIYKCLAFISNKGIYYCYYKVYVGIMVVWSGIWTTYCLAITLSVDIDFKYPSLVRVFGFYY